MITLQQGQYGFDLTIDTFLDLTSTTALRVTIRQPGGHRIIKNLDASAIGPPGTGQINVPIVTGDLALVGDHLIDVADVTPGRMIKSGVQKFRVALAA